MTFREFILANTERPDRAKWFCAVNNIPYCDFVDIFNENRDIFINCTLEKFKIQYRDGTTALPENVCVCFANGLFRNWDHRRGFYAGIEEASIFQYEVDACIDYFELDPPELKVDTSSIDFDIVKSLL